MPVAPIFKNEALDQPAIAAVAAAFTIACDDLHLSLYPHPITENLAKQIISAAQTGERDPGRLAEMGIDALAADLVAR
jgi:hypothetical protein